MNLEGLTLSGDFHLGLPIRPLGYLLLAAYLALPLVILLRAGGRRQDRTAAGASGWGLRLMLLLAAPVASLALLVRLPSAVSLPAPGEPSIAQGPAASIFGAVPWILAGGYLGEPLAALAGLLGGVARGGWESFQALTPLRMAAQAALVAWLIRRPYREWPGRLARRPIFSALLVGLAFSLFRTLEVFAYSRGESYAALDFALSQFIAIGGANTLELAVGGLIAEAIRWAFPDGWYRPKTLITGPYNRSLAARFAALFLALGIVGGGVLTYTNWRLARTAAERLISDQMIQTASQVGESIPFFVQMGRFNLRQIADDVAAHAPGDPDLAAASLGRGLRSLTLFSRLAVYDADRRLIASAPADPEAEAPLPLEVEAALASAINGIPQEVISGAPPREAGVQLVFLVPISRSDQSGPWALAGWANLTTTPLLQPALERLRSFNRGEAFITDSRGMIILHADPDRWLRRIDAQGYVDGEVRLQTSSAGGRELAYAEPVEGYSWRVIISMPQSAVDTLALSTTANLMAAMTLIGAVVILTAYVSGRRLTKPIRQMAATAESIALGNLDQEVRAAGEDELGRLTASFEHMRKSLKSQLGEIELLLSASKRMASSFELAQVLPPILGNVRELLGADVIRLVLADSQPTPLTAYSAGEDSGDWHGLDAQMLELCGTRGQFLLENPSRARAILDLSSLSDPIEALAAVPLQHEDKTLGALWLGHRHPRAITANQLNLLSILAGQLSISLANARLYHQAEAERNRLMAILRSTPDAVIAIDTAGRLTLANAAAEAVLRAAPSDAIGGQAEEWITSPELILLLTQKRPEQLNVELKVEGGRMLYASATDIFNAAGEAIGRVAVMWDITHFKVLDTLKSELVSTVSHDLRAPLTLMRGYATMLSMVGEMNEQQGEFVAKILSSVERMTNLVDDLLDLSRIETGIGLSITGVQVEDIIEEVLSSFRPQAVNKQVALQAELDSEMSPVEADPMLLRQAVANLVDNAIKYTPSGGRVMVSATQADGRQLISVEDSGVGIAPADQPRLFEKFFRAQKSQEGGKRGSGLGLAIVKSIIEQHHGRVQVESRLGVGSKFTLAFPLRQLQPEIG